MPLDSDQPSVAAAAERFATTHWSLIVAAKDQTSPQAREALAALCSTYWYPLYAYIRRQGYSADQAQDLTQEFFTHLLEPNFLGKVEQEKGKFRSFLLACCKHFLANERDRGVALKRGGGRRIISINLSDAEGRYTTEPAHTETPEKLFERRWAVTLLDQVLKRLRDEFVAAGRSQLFDQLKVFLTGSTRSVSQAKLADKLDLSEGAAKALVHRLRRRYRELLREEIGRTLDDPAQVDSEIRDLFTLLGS